ncbi:MAG: toll/interleukin-1 receptor domain-containing protein [Pseudomonadales bacterium]
MPLKNFRLKPWLDLEDILPGMEWQQSITNAIKMSSYFIALISSNSVNKRGFIQKGYCQVILCEIPLLGEYTKAFQYSDSICYNNAQPSK